MIDFLRGTLAHLEHDYIVLDVNGVGYRLFCPNPFQFQNDREITVFVHHHVREDAILLYGFESREEQALFRKLLDVSGIGPRVALGILAGCRPEALIAAVQQENVAFLTKLQGIGKKTAQRMVLDLKDKLGAVEVTALSNAASNAQALGIAPGGMANWMEAKEGLMALGMTEQELDLAWQTMKDQVQESDTVDQVMKAALKVLYKG
ncbi:Holliday junction branch migration protein RuvA [Marinicrinis lubricantis]|uniref:Holliday junction branch migration complex subunit RuvA n=1 Tax=Marinicrinis lubricantis TaxID=2086470 RepID=A0ABW1ITU0_9BACL